MSFANFYNLSNNNHFNVNDSKSSSRHNSFLIFTVSLNYRKTVGVYYRSGNGMVNHRTIIALQDKFRVNTQPVIKVMRLTIGVIYIIKQVLNR